MSLYFFILIFVFISIIIYVFIKNKLKIKLKTFFKKGFQVRKGIFGIYCYCGFQGDGKTYSCVEYVKDNQDNIVLFSNVDISGVDYVSYKGFDGLLKLRDSIDMSRYLKKDYIIFEGKRYLFPNDKQVLFIYDELFSELQRGSKINTDVLDFITQMRKRSFILLTTSQIWSDIPITWRRLTRYQIDCSMHKFLFINYLKKVFHDAEHMKWSNDDQEFIAPIISTTITHTRKFIADSYDTFQLIHNKYSKFVETTKDTSFEVETNISPDDTGEDKGLDMEFWNDIGKNDIDDRADTTTSPMSELCQRLKMEEKYE